VTPDALYVFGGLILAVAANFAARYWLERLHGVPATVPSKARSHVRTFLGAAIGCAAVLVIIHGPVLSAVGVAALFAAYMFISEGQRMLSLGVRRSRPWVQGGVFALLLLQSAGWFLMLVPYTILRWYRS
jgi:hypothetical protein